MYQHFIQLIIHVKNVHLNVLYVYLEPNVRIVFKDIFYIMLVLIQHNAYLVISNIVQHVIQIFLVQLV